MSAPRSWVGAWVGSGEDGPAAPLLRGEIEVPDGVVRGVLHVAGLGLHRTTINGSPVTDARLESGTAAFDRRIPFSSYPVDLSAGRSVLGVELGRGFYAMATPNVWGWHEAPWRGLRMVRLDLEMLDGEGALVRTFGSDLSWRWATGGTRFDSLYEGESFDAREVPHGWDEPGFDASTWAQVQLAEPPAGELAPQERPPIRVVASRQPVGWSGGGGDPLVADFGIQLAGWVRVALPRVPVGTRVRLHYAESADEHGARAQNQHVFTDRFATDELVVDDRTRAWEPRFTYQGFRYVQVDGVEDPSDIELTAQHAHSDVTETSSFSCSDDVLTWIDTAMRRTVLNNLHHLPTDTPLYEKNGWLGDVHVALEAMLHQFDLQALMKAWAVDIADTQDEHGALASIAPTPGWGYLRAPEWTTVYPYLLSRLQAWYGDRALPEGFRDTLVHFLEHELTHVDANGLVTGILGDYLAPGSVGTPPEDDLRIAASCYLVRGLRVGADLFTADPADAALVHRFRTAADSLAQAINAAFLDETAGCYRSERESRYRQTSNILPLAFGITPPDAASAVADRLAAEIRAHGARHDAGCLGLSELFEVLTVHGHSDLALQVATGREAPSWGAWMEAGATTMLEMWGPEQRSLDHFFMGAMSRWLYERVAGVRMAGPQWSRFEVEPAARGNLRHAAFWLRGPRGELGASWSQEPDGLRLVVRVPEGTTATVRLRDREPVDVGTGEWGFTEAGSPDDLTAVSDNGSEGRSLSEIEFS
ncbi:family 78 glycoside hydrolase catalytic domain [Pseudactinotalea sp.]|uniref:family 78 glycoside hydrolase catalytic domain n=1 Tax=Pseudactinotalea sp. TaxID=1926260 RepID=UPI003B3BABEA